MYYTGHWIKNVVCIQVVLTQIKNKITDKWAFNENRNKYADGDKSESM